MLGNVPEDRPGGRCVSGIVESLAQAFGDDRPYLGIRASETRGGGDLRPPACPMSVKRREEFRHALA